MKHRRFGVLIVLILLLTLAAGIAQGQTGVPKPTPSYYMNDLTGNPQADLDRYYQVGCDDGKAGLTGVVILDFGAQSRRSDGTTGALDQQGRFHSRRDIGAATRGYLWGFWRCTRGFTQKLQVGVGTNNDGDWFSANPKAAADDWAGLVNDIDAFLNGNNPEHRDMRVQIIVAGANDIESEWSEAQAVHAWIREWEKTTTLDFFNFGTAVGCPSSGTTAYSGNGVCQVWTRDGELGPLWHQSDVYAFSWGYHSAYVVAEVYNTSGINGKEWQQVSLWGYLQSPKHEAIKFSGTMSQAAACGQPKRGPCAPYDEAPNDSWADLYRALNSDPRTAQTVLQFSTNIVYHGG